MDQTAQYLIVHLDANNHTNPYRTKALRQDETVVLGHNHLQDRFSYQDDESLSGDHVQIYISNGLPIVRDMGSTNGTSFLLNQADVLKPVVQRVVKKQEVPVVPPVKVPVRPETTATQSEAPSKATSTETEKPKQKAEIIGQNYNINLSESVRSFITKQGSEIAAGSDKGINYKDHNEDRVVVSPDDEFLAVIDGMGGHGSGDKAAQIIAEELQNNPNNVAAAITKAKERMQEEAKNFTISPDAGAPFISARILRENGTPKLEYSYAGDCSLAVIDKQGRVKHVSKTDSYLNSPIFLARNNNVKLTADQMLYHEDRNVVSKAIDKKNDKFTTVTIGVEPGDRVILMSDGINDNLTPYELSVIVSGKSASDAIKAVDQVTSGRMQNKQQIIDSTPDRATSGFFSDGYRSEPKKDNRGIAIIDVK